MWLFILAAKYGCTSAYSTAVGGGFSSYKIPVCHALVRDDNGNMSPRILYFDSCFSGRTTYKFVFDFCECRIPIEGESYTYKLESWDRAIFCYNTTGTPKPTNTPQATKIIQPALKLPECSHYKKPKTALAVFYQMIFIA